MLENNILFIEFPSDSYRASYLLSQHFQKISDKLNYSLSKSSDQFPFPLDTLIIILGQKTKTMVVSVYIVTKIL